MYSRHKCFQLPVVEFQSTRLSRASTQQGCLRFQRYFSSIHKALTSLDYRMLCSSIPASHFNPQGSHEPRRSTYQSYDPRYDFNPQGSHEPRHAGVLLHSVVCDFNPQGSHEPRQQKYTIILASMPNLYILIIHLQQIIQQVKKFSRILILFSGRLQCESPWNFMCNYYSHQSFLTKNQPSFKLPPLSICAKFSRTILNNHLKWRSQLTVYPAVYYVLSRSKNSNVFT